MSFSSSGANGEPMQKQTSTVKESVINVFDDIAEQRSWEQLYSGKLDRVNYNFKSRQRAVDELLNPYAAGNVLDIGCGSGDLCPFYMEKGARYLGLDLSQKMIERANANYSSHVERGKARFQVADCESLPYGTGEADVVSAVALIEYLPDPSRALDEIARVTKNGGYALVTVPYKYCINTLFRLALKPIIALIMPIYKLINKRSMTVMSAVKHHSYGSSRLDKIMSERKFEKVASRYTNFHVIPHPLDHIVPSLYIKLSEIFDRSGKGNYFKFWASNYIALYRKS